MSVPETPAIPPMPPAPGAGVAGVASQRVETVRRAAKSWVAALFDLTGRNNLLRYRELKLGTLDLTAAAPGAVASLLAGRSVRVAALFPAEEARVDAARRLRAIYRKAKENFEERGVQTLHLGCGLATWQTKAEWDPAAPVLLRRAELKALGAAQDDFEIALVEEMEVNPPFLHLLRTESGLSIDADALLDRVEGVIDEPWELERAYAWVKEQAATVPGFAVEPRLVLANFSYAKLPMVRDLESHLDSLVAHDLVAAVAGDQEAGEAVRAAAPADGAVPEPDDVLPADEFVVLDADASQQLAVNAVLAGESLIVRGPPGTGKSQTIANLIASLVVLGRKVLFVAEKRAAIDAVLKRLDQTGLGDLVLDLHGGVGSRRALAETLGRSLSATRTVPPVDASVEEQTLLRDRTELNAYVAALHQARAPWGVSMYAARAGLLGLGPEVRTEVRFRGDVLARLDGAAVEGSRTELVSLVRLGGLVLGSSGSPWARSPIASDQEAQQAFALVDDLGRRALPGAGTALEAAAAVTGLPPVATVGDWSRVVDLWRRVARTRSVFRPEIYGQDLERLAADTAKARGGGFARFVARMFSGRYRAARRQLRSILDGPPPPDRDLHFAASEALDEMRAWRAAGGTGMPAAPVSVEAVGAALSEVTAGLARVATVAGVEDPSGRPVADVGSLLSALAADRATLLKLPEIHRLRGSLVAAGLAELLADLERRAATEEVAVGALRHAWLQSVVDQVQLADPVIGRFSADAQERVVAEFRGTDHTQLAASAARVRRICAEHVVQARERFADQDRLLLAYAGKKRRHEPVATLLEGTADVLLALKPCWAMSPLVVSQILPARPLFDVVVFDEASQITPADAITSILRGRQLVVAGDERQLPPTAFFVSETAEDEEEDEEAFTIDAAPAPAPAPGVRATDFQSILDALKPLLPRWRMLQWHYRSRDERLVAFSNAYFYDGALTTFPGVGGEARLRHVLAPTEPGAGTNSPSPEVRTVADLVIEHARSRPGESLGVIAMGIKHANRIEEAVRERLKEHRDLDPFFDESREERFFVKNLERVQGDERDAIILSIGYGKDDRGRLVYRFGPLLGQGGERRLNVAITRAKQRLTLVSSFTSQDMDPAKLGSEGMQLVRKYLDYVESGGEHLGDRGVDKPELDPFEIDVRDALAPHMPLTPQFGASGYWIDFAAGHPARPGRYVLAIECDGASYHSGRSARERDRLRQEQLERLGWTFHRIWSTDWFEDRQAAVSRAVDAYQAAVAAADVQAVAPPPPPPPIPVPDEHAQAAAQFTAPPLAVASARPDPRPPLKPGLPIDEYAMRGLVLLARWVESDGILRTEDEVLEELMRELGFHRRGTRIVPRLTEAIRLARGAPA